MCGILFFVSYLYVGDTGDCGLVVVCLAIIVEKRLVGFLVGEGGG